MWFTARGLRGAARPLSRRWVHLGACRGPQRLRIALDAKYPGIIEWRVGAARHDAFRTTRSTTGPIHERDMCLSSRCTRSHLPVSVPAARAGQEARARIVLEPWQRGWSRPRLGRSFAGASGPTAAPSSIAPTSTGMPYEYLSYDFTQHVNGHRRAVRRGLRSRGRLSPASTAATAGARGDVRINRRASVALMLEHVGLKAMSERLDSELATRLWRNWQTRDASGALSARPWRFESSQPHQDRDVRRNGRRSAAKIAPPRRYRLGD